MKKTILKYSSLLALLGSFFFSTYIFAAECETGTSPTAGCTIGVSDITYTLTGDIEPDPGDNGIRFNSADNVTVNLTGGILGINQGRGLDYLFSDSNTTTMIGDITVVNDAISAGIRFNVAHNNITTLTGDISTNGLFNKGVLLIGNSNTINITGDMTSSGNSAASFDITLGSTSNTINLTGNITSSGSSSHGFILDEGASSNTINMTGNITTTGNNTSGFKLDDSESNTINMTGNINTSGDVGVGIWLNNTSHMNVISMTGDIVTSGANAAAILASTSDGNTITMTGDIQTSGTGGWGYAVTSSFTNNTTINGNVTTTGDNAEAIYLSSGHLTTTTITGNIITSGLSSRGVYLSNSDENTTTMTGNITTSGTGADGILIDNASDSNTINMTGNFTTSGSGASAVAIDNASNNNMINLTGNVISSGTGSHGIEIISSDSNTVNWIGGMTSTNVGQHAILINDSESNIINITGDINSSGLGSTAMWIADATVSNTINLTGNINVTGQNASGLYIRTGSNSNTFTINGNIITSGTDGDSEPILLSNADSNTITLSGKVQSLGGDQAISLDADSDANTFNIQSGSTFLGDFENLGTNTVITNQGVMDGIDNTGSIATFNNAQTGAAYSGTLPVNYNIIINSSTSYGQMFVTSEAGSTNFGLSSLSTSIFNGNYSNVMTGVSDGNVGATRSGSLEGNGTSSAGTANWALTETASESGAWDLNITGDYVYFGSVATLQSSVNNTASAMRGAFNSITSSMNFANMTTYDCNLFGNNGGCVSVGGRYTGTDNPDTTNTAVVAKAGYKFNEHFRYGAFVDQTANSKTGNVDLDMNTPMVGLMGVWNQNPDQLGMQVKLANTFQSTDASITRNDGLSTNYTGDTDINAQSYVAELSWRHLNNQKDTLLQPFVATRYAIIDQDGYSDGFVNYGSVEQKTLTALAGVKAFYQYSHKMTYMGSLGIEHDLDEDADDLSVSVSGVSGLTAASMTDGGEDKTRLLGSVGARFFVTPNQRLEGKVMYEQLRYNNADNTTAYVNYTIGF